MLIPLGTDRPLRRTTVVTLALMGVNAAVFAVQEYLRLEDPEGLARMLGAGQVWGWRFHWYNLITSAFLHANFMHIAGNMLILWVFGPNIEDRLGRLWFLGFYLLGGAASGALHAAFDDAPAIGASGAIAAVTGAYLVMFPKTVVRCFYIFALMLVRVPAWWFIGFAVVWDLIMQGTGRFGGIGGMGQRTAHLAHIGGYVYGMSTAFVLLWWKVVPREPWDLFSQGRQALRRRQIKSAAKAQERAIAQHWAQAKDGKRGAQQSGPVRETEKLAADRAAVSALMAAGDLSGAGAAYKRLADAYAHVINGTLLNRRQQLDLANWFYQQHDAEGAAYAYARFLEGYPKDSEAARVRLLLGMIHARSLNDPLRAKQLIAQAMGELRDDVSIEMAKRELAALG